MKPKLTVAREEFETKHTKSVENGTVYTVEIEKRDFCIFESHQEKTEKETTMKK